MNPVLALLLRVPLHGLGLLVAALPRPLELVLGRALGRFGLLVDFKRRGIARENMRRCLPELGPRELDALLRANYEHYGILGLELLHMFAPIPGHFRRYAERVMRVTGFENWEKAHAKGKGVLVFGGHSANWELGSAAGGLHGTKPTIVTRHLKPKWLDEWMEKTRLSTGVACAYQPRTMGAILKALRRQETLGFVIDQYMPPPMGEPLRFFGATVHTLTAVAPLARRTGAAIVPVHNIREEDGVIRLYFGPEFILSDDDRADSQRMAEVLEKDIRATPSQWLWAHRRFKNAVWPEPQRRRQPA